VQEIIVSMERAPRLSDSVQFGEGERTADLEEGTQSAAASIAPAIDPAVEALCIPLSENDPCGPDLEQAGDAQYLNFLAQVEGVLPTAFFSLEDGKPFDPTTVELGSQVAEADRLLARSRDIRLLAIRARLLVLNRDIAGFSVTMAAIAECLDRQWDKVHPLAEGENLTARRTAISAFDLPTVIFPLQYTPLFEGRRAGSVTYRAWITATGQVKSRTGEVPPSAVAIDEAIASADPAEIAGARKHLALLDESVRRICKAFAAHGIAVLDALGDQVRKMRALIDPRAASDGNSNGEGGPQADEGQVTSIAAVALTSISDAARALAAVGEYYARSEPSSPVLPLVRQAHELIGKSFMEIMAILVPTHVDKAAFQIGTNPVFDLPVNKLPSLSSANSSSEFVQDTSDAGSSAPAVVVYRVGSRSQALALLESVQRYFRHAEPSSPVPMLCQRALALAGRDFMGVLEDVLPKSALKALNVDR
jgi:type VI secretion system protein ImpA